MEESGSLDDQKHPRLSHSDCVGVIFGRQSTLSSAGRHIKGLVVVAASVERVDFACSLVEPVSVKDTVAGTVSETNVNIYLEFMLQVMIDIRSNGANKHVHSKSVWK